MIKEILVVALLSGGHYVGDDNNVRGITQSLKDKGFNNVQYEVVIQKSPDGKYSLDNEKIYAIQNTLDQQNTLVVAAGLDGIDALAQLKKGEGNIFVWSGHQITSKLESNMDGLNAIVVPESAVNESVKEELGKRKIKLIKTVGVPHNKSTEEVIKAYEAWDKPNMPADQKFLLVSLPGDAPDASGTMHYYTKESAEKLGSQLGNIARDNNMLMLVTNGPRTGQYDPDTAKKLQTHGKDDPIDAVSAAFLAGAQQKLDSTKIIFADFKFGVPSMFNAFLGAVLENPDSIAVIGGDSTSQVTEATNLLKPDQVYVVRNEAMNEGHHSHIDHVMSRRYAHELRKDMDKLPQEPLGVKIVPTDAALAAKEIIQILGNNIK